MNTPIFGFLNPLAATASNDFPNGRLIQHKNEANRSQCGSFKITKNENHYLDFALKLVSFIP